MLSTLQRKIKNLLTPVHKNERVSFNTQSIYKGHLNVTYKGIKAIRCPFDYVIYQMIIAEIKPDLIIEIGTNQGGGAVYLADLLEINDIRGEVHTIDVGDYVDEKTKLDTRIKFFTDGWENYDLHNVKPFKKIMVIEDAAHTYSCTMGAIKKFAGVVSIGSYLIVEDGIVNNLGMSDYFEGGPLKALREFLPKHPEFEVDRKWCDFFGKNATFNVNGYLKRTR